MEESFLMTGFYIKKHHYDEETRKAKLSDWRKRYRATFPYEGNSVIGLICLGLINQ